MQLFSWDFSYELIKYLWNGTWFRFCWLLELEQMVAGFRESTANFLLVSKPHANSGKGAQGSWKQVDHPLLWPVFTSAFYVWNANYCGGLNHCGLVVTYCAIEPMMTWSIGPSGTNFSEISMKLCIFFKEMHLNMLFAYCWPFCEAELVWEQSGTQFIVQ